MGNIANPSSNRGSVNRTDSDGQFIELVRDWGSVQLHHVEAHIDGKPIRDIDAG
jgi:hypothetical protein